MSKIVHYQRTKLYKKKSQTQQTKNNKLNAGKFQPKVFNGRKPQTAYKGKFQPRLFKGRKSQRNLYKGKFQYKRFQRKSASDNYISPLRKIYELRRRKKFIKPWNPYKPWYNKYTKTWRNRYIKAWFSKSANKWLKYRPLVTIPMAAQLLKAYKSKHKWLINRKKYTKIASLNDLDYTKRVVRFFGVGKKRKRRVFHIGKTKTVKYTPVKKSIRVTKLQQKIITILGLRANRNFQQLKYVSPQILRPLFEKFWQLPENWDRLEVRRNWARGANAEYKQYVSIKKAVKVLFPIVKTKASKKLELNYNEKVNAAKTFLTKEQYIRFLKAYKVNLRGIPKINWFKIIGLRPDWKNVQIRRLVKRNNPIMYVINDSRYSRLLKLTRLFKSRFKIKKINSKVLKRPTNLTKVAKVKVFKILSRGKSYRYTRLIRIIAIKNEFSRIRQLCNFYSLPKNFWDRKVRLAIKKQSPRKYRYYNFIYHNIIVKYLLAGGKISKKYLNKVFKYKNNRFLDYREKILRRYTKIKQYKQLWERKFKRFMKNRKRAKRVNFRMFSFKKFRNKFYNKNKRYNFANRGQYKNFNKLVRKYRQLNQSKQLVIGKSLRVLPKSTELLKRYKLQLFPRKVRFDFNKYNDLTSKNFSYNKFLQLYKSTPEHIQDTAIQLYTSFLNGTTYIRSRRKKIKKVVNKKKPWLNKRQWFRKKKFLKFKGEEMPAALRRKLIRHKKFLKQYSRMIRKFYKFSSAKKFTKTLPTTRIMQLTRDFLYLAGKKHRLYFKPFNPRKKLKMVVPYKKAPLSYIRKKKSIFKMKLLFNKLFTWLYNTNKSQVNYMLGPKVRDGFLMHHLNNNQFIYKKQFKLNLSKLS